MNSTKESFEQAYLLLTNPQLTFLPVQNEQNLTKLVNSYDNIHPALRLAMNDCLVIISKISMVLNL